MHLVSAIIQESAGKSALEFAQENLFTPLGISEATWDTDPAGVNIGWKGMRMDPTDTAKLGWLYLSQGHWENLPVLPPDWVAASTTSQVEGQQFGYQWYLDRTGYFNWDFPGQWVIAVPEVDLLAVLSGSIPENQAWNVRILMESLILPAIKSDGPLPSDAEAQSALEQKVAELGQAPESQPVPPLPETASRITGRKILLVANNQPTQAHRPVRNARLDRVPGHVTAIVVAADALWLFDVAGWLRFDALKIPTLFFWAMVLGGALLGAGMAIGGYCPGTSVVGLFAGRIDAIFFMLGMMIGMTVFAMSYDALEPIYQVGKGPAGQTLSGFTGLPTWLWLLLLAGMAAGGFLIGNWFESRRGGKITAKELASGS